MAITTLAGPYRFQPQRWRPGGRGHLGPSCPCDTCSAKRRLAADTALSGNRTGPKITKPPAADGSAARNW